MDDLIDNVRTKSISDIVEPFANQVLKCENLLSTNPDAKLQCRKLCEDLSFVVMDLSTVIGQLTRFADANLQPEGINCSKQLKVVALDLKNLSDSCENNDLNQELPDVTSYLLSTLMKSLLWYDQTILLAAQTSIKNFKTILTALERSKVVYELLPLTKNLVNEAGILYPMLQDRVNDLISLVHKNDLSVKMNVLHKLLKLHLKAITNLARFPLNRHSRATRDFVIKQMQECLTSISDILDSKVKDTQTGDWGRFLKNMDKLLEILETSDKHSNTWPEAEPCMLAIIEHAILLSQSCEAKDRNIISSTCERVVKEFHALQELLKTTEVPSSDFQLACEILADFLELLEQSVNTVLLKRIVYLDADVECSHNLLWEQVRSATVNRKTEDIQKLLDDFDNAVDTILQTAFFSVASTADLKKVRLVNSAVEGIEFSSSELAAAWVSAYLQPNDEAAIRNVKLWQSFLTQELIGLRQNLDSITDPAAFCHVIENEQRPLISLLKREISGPFPDIKLLTSKIQFLTKRALTLVQEQLVATSDFKADNLPVQSLRKCLTEFKGAEFLMSQNCQDQSLRLSLVKRAELIMSYVNRLVDGLKAEEEWEEAPTHVGGSTQDTENTLTNAGTPQERFPSQYHHLPLDVTDAKTPLSNLSRLSNAKRAAKVTRERNAGTTPQRKSLASPTTPLPANYSAVLKHTPNKPWRKQCKTPKENVAPKISEPENSCPNHSDAEGDEAAQTFDLTEILDCLTSLDSTLRSNLTENVTVVTRDNGSTDLGNTASVATPSLPSNFTLDSQSAMFSSQDRLNDLDLVRKRIAALQPRF